MAEYIHPVTSFPLSTKLIISNEAACVATMLPRC